MNPKPLIWDLPVRICHWAFALALTLSLSLALAVDDDGPLFRWHMLFGLVAAFVLAVRIVLGLVGSRPARFTSFPLRAETVWQYIRDVITVNPQRREFAGNNPGSALVAVAMFVLVPAIVLTGVWADTEIAEEAHGILAYILLGVIGLHLAGIVVHTITRRDNIGLAMVDGRKTAPPSASLRSAHGVWGMVVLAATAAWSFALLKNYDPVAATTRLPLFGSTIHLGENKGAEDRSGRSGETHRPKRHDDDD